MACCFWRATQEFINRPLRVKSILFHSKKKEDGLIKSSMGRRGLRRIKYENQAGIQFPSIPIILISLSYDSCYFVGFKGKFYFEHNVTRSKANYCIPWSHPSFPKQFTPKIIYREIKSFLTRFPFFLSFKKKLKQKAFN